MEAKDKFEIVGVMNGVVGKDAFVADADNENYQIAVAYDGHIIAGQNTVIGLKAYKGAEDVSATATFVLESVSDESLISASVSGTELHIDFSAEAVCTRGTKYSVKVRTSYEGYSDRMIVVSVVPVFAAKDGVVPTIYELMISEDSVVFTYDADGKLTGDYWLEFSLLEKTESGASIIETAPDECNIFCIRGDGNRYDIGKITNTSQISRFRRHNVTSNYAAAYDEVSFELEYNGKVVDRETVPVIKNGKNGTEGQDGGFDKIAGTYTTSYNYDINTCEGYAFRNLENTWNESYLVGMSSYKPNVGDTVMIRVRCYDGNMYICIQTCIRVEDGYREQVFTFVPITYWIAEKGEKGDTGTSVSNVENYYLISSKATGVVNTEGTWKPASELESIKSKLSKDTPYLWNYEEISLNDNSTINTDAVLIGTFGEDGRGISGVEEAYLLSAENNSSNIPLDEGSWSNTYGVVTYEKPYLWNRERLIFDDDTKGNWTAPAIICVMGDKGEDGTSVNIRNSYTASQWANVKDELAKTAANGDAYLVDGDLVIWDGTAWNNLGQIQGPAGHDGSDAHVHIAYANFDESFHMVSGSFSTTDATDKEYRGMFSDFFAKDPTLSKQEGTPHVVDPITGAPYIWQKAKGDKGASGDRGPSGTSVRILGPKGSISELPKEGNVVGDGWIVGGELYLWDGKKWNPVGQVQGPMGDKCWVHIAYANFNINGTIIKDSFSVSNSKGKEYTGVYVNYTDGSVVNDPDPTVEDLDAYGGPYKWNKNRGENGTDGNSVSTIRNWYKVTAANVTPSNSSTTGWSQNVDTESAKLSKDTPNLWNFEEIVYTKTSDSKTDPVVVARYVEDGVSVTGMQEQFQITARGARPTKDKWIDDENFTGQISNENPYLWNRERPIYSDNREVTWGKEALIGVYGDRGDDGTSINVKPDAASCKAVGDAYIDQYGHLQVLTTLSPRKFEDAGEIKGPKGDDGQKAYVHIAYANFSNFPHGMKNFSTTDPSDRAYMGVCSDWSPKDPELIYTEGMSESVDSDTGAPYKWSHTLGNTGKSISEVVEYYQTNDSDTTPPSLFAPSYTYWKTAPELPTASFRYMWNFEHIIFTDGSYQDTTPVVAATYVTDGDDGRGITGFEEWYKLTNRKGEVIPGCDWRKNTPYQITADKPCLWNKEKITYDKYPYSEETTEALIGVYGEMGDEGTSIIAKGKRDSLPTKGSAVGEAFVVNGHLYVWSYNLSGTLEWIDCGKIDGESAYVHIIYAKKNDSGYYDYHKSDATERDWMGVLTNNTKEDVLPSASDRTGGDYKWSYTKGEQGIPGESKFKSTVFKRSSVKLTSRPTGGTYDSPLPFPLNGWSDGIPDDSSLPLYASTRTFYSDKTEELWSVPKLMADTADFDVEFSKVEKSPGTPTTHPGNWSNDATSGVIWMATRTIKNGVASEWTISQVKGEKGETGGTGPQGPDGVTIVISEESFVLKEEQYAIVFVGVDLFKGNTQIEYGQENGQYLCDNLSNLPANLSWAGFTNHDGHKFAYRFTKAVNKTVNGDVKFGIAYNGVKYYRTIHFSTVSDGETGPQGPSGAKPRVRFWKSGETYLTGAAGDAWYDIVYMESNNNQPYLCIKEHTSSETNKPTSAQEETYWRAASYFDFVASDLVMSDKIVTRMFNSQQAFVEKGFFNHVTATSGNIGDFKIQNGGLYNSSEKNETFFMLDYHNKDNTINTSFELGAKWNENSFCNIYAKGKSALYCTASGEGNYALGAGGVLGGNGISASAGGYNTYGIYVNGNNGTGIYTSCNSSGSWALYADGHSRIKGLHLNARTLNESSTSKILNKKDDIVCIAFTGAKTLALPTLAEAGKVLILRNQGSAAVTINGATIYRKGVYNSASSVILPQGGAIMLVALAMNIWFEF